MREYLIASHRIIRTQEDQGHRRWHCDCPDFDRRLVSYGEGFCEQLAQVIEATQCDLSLIR